LPTLAASSIQPAAGQHPQRLDCPPNPRTHKPTPVIATAEHQIGQSSGFELSVGAG
jgi:hypothetical protein